MITANQIRAITVIQPYASLIAWTKKWWETRGWQTDYRGPLVIHAARSIELFQPLGADIIRMLRHPEEVDETQFCYQFVKAVKEVHPAPFKLNMLPLGAALCIADLIDVQPTDNLPPLPMREMVFGNFASGRFAWRLENIRLFPQPIPMRGLPGLWIYSEPLPDNLISVKSVQQGVFIA